MTFDERVAAMRGKAEPKKFSGRKADATPEQWASSLDYHQAWKSKNITSVRQSNAEQKRRWRRANPGEVRLRNAAWYHSDPEHARSLARGYYHSRVATPEGREMARDSRSRWRRSHRELTRGAAKDRWSRDPDFRLRSNLRRRLNKFLKDGVGGSAVRDLGCSVADLKAHLERQFLPGMTWDNWGVGQGKWQIDHIYPLAQADLTVRLVVLAVCNWRNLQPLWFKDNNRKGDTVTPEAQQLFDGLVSEFTDNEGGA